MVGIVAYNAAWMPWPSWRLHRFYLGKWLSGGLCLHNGGLFLVVIIYDLWTLNEQIRERNLPG